MGTDSSPDEELERELEEASVDSAMVDSAEHSAERDAHHRQGLIEKGTRKYDLDED